MIKVHVGDMFKSEVHTIVNTVNCVGVMGKGIALEFKKRFPEMFKDYEDLCKHGDVKLGKPYIYPRLLKPWILNFPTKDHWRSLAQLQAIEDGLIYLKKHYQKWGIESLAVPPLGCGEGQLEWRVVGPTLYKHLKDLDIPIELYAPYGTPHEELKPDFLDATQFGTAKDMPDPKWVTAPMVALVAILSQLEKQPYHYPIGRTIFQKITYVATSQGLPTEVQYQRGSFGPFSKDLKPLQSRLINNGLITEKKEGQMFRVRVGKTFTDAAVAYKLQLEGWENIINKTCDLFMRIRSTNQAELVATVLYADNHLNRTEKDNYSECDIFKEVVTWKKKRKPPINDKELARTVRNLTVLNWLHATPCETLPIEDDTCLTH